jgi:hypothetical protein
VERATRRYLLYFVLPAWIGAGLVDWQRHRQTKIEETAGSHESLIHALMMAELGLPILMGLFLGDQRAGPGCGGRRPRRA